MTSPHASEPVRRWPRASSPTSARIFATVGIHSEVLMQFSTACFASAISRSISAAVYAIVMPWMSAPVMRWRCVG